MRTRELVQYYVAHLGFAFSLSPDGLAWSSTVFNKLKTCHRMGGFYRQNGMESCLQNDAFLNAALVTLKVAVGLSTLATVLGTIGGYILVRGGVWQGARCSRYDLRRPVMPR